jgi:hypothetical protein
MTTTWTMAYRKPRANRFQRVTNWAGTWHQARDLAGKFVEANPGLQVYYVPSAASETPGHEDTGNILTETGRRVRIRETGELSAEMLAQVGDADQLKAEFDARAY